MVGGLAIDLVLSANEHGSVAVLRLTGKGVKREPVLARL
jgi:hypothetical protein